MIVEVLESELVIDESLVDEECQEIRNQVKEYVSGDRNSFDLDFSFPGGELGFALRKISEIPRGETRTYGELADQLETSPVRIGQFCSQNTLPLIVPCHRVIGRNDPGGYQAGREVKRKLLELEAEPCSR